MIIDDRIANINMISRRDLVVFQRADERFGAGRMITLKPMSVRVIKRTGIDRFLVGNRTDAFTPQALRVTFVPMDARMRKTGNKKADHEPKFYAADVGPLVSKNFGKEFVATLGSGNWKVKGLPIRARTNCLSCHTSAKRDDTLGYIVCAAEK